MMEHQRVLIVGAGPAGLCMALKLKEAGIEDFVVLESGDGVGGTWYWNTYPGCQCDIPSALYSFSFEQKPDWSRPFGDQREIAQYLQEIAVNYELMPHLRFNSRVRDMVWDEAQNQWSVSTVSGETLSSDFVVSAQGMHNEPYIPGLQGLESFAGTRFHSARWNQDHDLAGRKVAIIGSAASAVQIAPAILPQVAELTIFQRTPNWILPKDDTPYTPEQLEQMRADPDIARQTREEIFSWAEATVGLIYSVEGAQTEEIEAAFAQNIAVVEDPEIREKLTPRYLLGAKRMLMSNHYYPLFNDKKVTLVTEPIERITAQGVMTVEGGFHDADTLVLATGFQGSRFMSTIDVVGENQLSIHDAWKDGARAYKGMATQGFPNLFMLYGPNTNSGSMMYMIERQVEYVVEKLEYMASYERARIEIKAQAEAEYNERLQAVLTRIAALQEDVKGYFRAASGRHVTNWPFTMAAYTERLREDDIQDYLIS